MNLARMMNRREVLAVLGASALAACFSDRPDDGTGPNGDVTIDMTDQLTFSPATVTIQVGQTVTWRNTSPFPHTATGDASKANDPSNVELPAGAQPWDSGTITSGGEFSRTFDVSGTYRYFCIPHEAQDMVGTIIVTT